MAVKRKLEKILENNPGYEHIVKFKNIIVGKTEIEIERNMAQNTAYFTYTPVTSVEVKRTFSKMKMVLPDRKLCLTADYLNKLLVISCNQL